jgi:hypothetical protein
LRMRFGFGILVAKSHCAKANFANFYIGIG